MRRSFFLSPRDVRTRAVVAGRDAFDCGPGRATTYPERRRGIGRRPRLGVFVGPPDSFGRVEVEMAEAEPSSDEILAFYGGRFRFGGEPDLRPGDFVSVRDDGTVGLMRPNQPSIGRVVAVEGGGNVVDVRLSSPTPVQTTTGSRVDMLIVDDVPEYSLARRPGSAPEFVVQVGPRATAATVAAAINGIGVNVASVDMPQIGSAERFFDDRVAEAIRIGTTSAAYVASGSITFSPEAARSFDAIMQQNWSNRFEGAPLTEENLRSAIAAMERFGRGEAALRPDALVMPPDLADDVARATAEEISPSPQPAVEKVQRFVSTIEGVEVAPEASKWLSALLPYVGTKATHEDLAGLAAAVRDHGMALRAWDRQHGTGRILRVEPRAADPDEDGRLRYELRSHDEGDEDE